MGYGACPLAVPDTAVDNTAVCLYRQLRGWWGGGEVGAEGLEQKRSW